MTGLPVKLSQSEASPLYSWRSMAVSFGRCELSQSNERRFVPKCRRKNLLGVFAMTTWASTSGNFKAVSSSSLSFEEGLGARGEGGFRSKV